jgi:hypothetical protein
MRDHHRIVGLQRFRRVAMSSRAHIRGTVVKRLPPPLCLQDLFLSLIA